MTLPAAVVDTLSSDGSVWGAITPEHNGRLLLGGIANVFDSEVDQLCSNFSTK